MTNPSERWGFNDWMVAKRWIKQRLKCRGLVRHHSMSLAMINRLGHQD
jgi:hypothetical protein